MSRLLGLRWLSLWIAVASAVAAGEVGAAPLTLAEALRLAEQNGPTLAARNAQLDAARQAAVPAGELPDPKLSVGIENLPVTGADRFDLTSDSMTMQRIGVLQEVPNSGKRRARVEVAAASVARSEAEYRIEVQTVRRETALAWIKGLTVERKLMEFEQLERENQLLENSVRAQIAGGRGGPAAAVMPRQEAAMLAERRDELDTQRRQAYASLQRWIGVADFDAPAGDWPSWPVSRAALTEHLRRHPELTAFEPMTRLADAEIHEAEAGKTPDWGVELAYQKRGEQFGDMASLEFFFDLPVFASSRQDPKIAAKYAERLRLDSERESLLRTHAEMLETDLAEHERLDRAVQRQQTILLPLLREKIELTLAGYRANKSDLSEVIAARREWIDAQLKLIDLEGQRSQTAARLYFAYGDNEQ
jgi:outer membrane protein TolC